MIGSAYLMGVVDELPEGARRIVWLRYGLDGAHTRYLPEIAEQLGMQQETVRAHLARALAGIDEAALIELEEIAKAAPTPPLAKAANQRSLASSMFAPRSR